MECLFCKIVNNEIESKKIYEDDKVVVILDAYPDCDGHSLIIPKKHYDDLIQIDDETLLHINKVAKNIIPKLLDKLNAKGITTLINYGQSQLIKHFHCHLLPDFNHNKGKKEIIEIYNLLKEK